MTIRATVLASLRSKPEMLHINVLQKPVTNRNEVNRIYNSRPYPVGRGDPCGRLYIAVDFNWTTAFIWATARVAPTMLFPCSDNVPAF